MKKTPAMLSALALGLLASLALGDDVKTKGLLYDQVVIRDFTDGNLIFQFHETLKTEPLDKIAQITLTNDADFTAAEAALAKGQFKEAQASYAAAQKNAAGWKKNFILARQIAVAGGTGAADAAVKNWLELADAANGSVGMLALRPNNFAKSSPANEAAITALNAKLKTVKGEAYTTAIRQTLLDLYRAQGNAAEVETLTAQLGGAAKPPVNPATGKTTEPRPGPGTSPSTGTGTGTGTATVIPPTPVDTAPKNRMTADAGNTRLREVLTLLNDKQYDKAQKALQDQLQSFPDDNLSVALLYLGRAQMGLADATKGEEAKALYVQAGLSFMRVVAGYPTADEAPLALLGAGEANLKLGNKLGAQSAYEQAIARYAGTDTAKKADAALKAMQK